MKSHQNKTIQAQRINLVPLSINDINFLEEFQAEEDIRKYLYQDQVNDKRSNHLFILSEKNKFREYEIGIWIITLNPPEKTKIGLIRLTASETYRGQIEISFGLLKAYRKKGYTKDAIDSIIKFAFDRFNTLPKIIAVVNKENKESLALLRKYRLNEEPNLSDNDNWVFYFPNENVK